MSMRWSPRWDRVWGGALLTVACACMCPANAQEFHQTYALKPGQTVAIKSELGNVRVMAWDRADVKVDAVKRAAAGKNMSAGEVTVKNRAGLCIATRYTAAAGEFMVRMGWADLCSTEQPLSDSAYAEIPAIDYTVFVPRDAPVVVRLNHGDVEVEGTTGHINIDIQQGHLTAKDVSGECELYGSFSGVTVKLTKLERDTHLKTAVGPMTVYLAPGISARVEARAARAVRNDFGWAPMGTGSVSAKMGEGKSLLEVLNGSGGIEFRLMETKH